MGRTITIGKMAMAILAIGALVIAFGSTQWARKEDVDQVRKEVADIRGDVRELKIEMKVKMEAQKEILERIERKIP